MLIRADPTNKTISLLSFPRDLTVPIYCKREHGVHDEPDQLGLFVLRRPEGDAAHDQAPHRPARELPDHRELPRLQGGREQARRRLDGHRPPLLQQEHRHDRDRLREHRPAAGLPAAERRAGARLRAVPAHGLRPLPGRAPAGVRPLVPRADRAELLGGEGPGAGQRDGEQHRGRRGRPQGPALRPREVRVLRVWAAERARVPGSDPERRVRQPVLRGAAGRRGGGAAVHESRTSRRRRRRTPRRSARSRSSRRLPPSSRHRDGAERQRRRRAPPATPRTCSRCAATR